VKQRLIEGEKIDEDEYSLKRVVMLSFVFIILYPLVFVTTLTSSLAMRCKYAKD
jgi:hypothetical protein